jgi:NADPH-dependent curcumin reductase CurA
MKRHGCLSRRTYDSTEGLLRNWMENNASYYQGRDFDREFDGAQSKAADLVEYMTTDEVVAKLGNHLHR